MGISLIVAMDENNLIGTENMLPWHLPNDLQRVKEITSGFTIVMGRKNYESIGHPLPDRRNVILTRNTEYEAEGCEIIHTPEEAFKYSEDEELFIFGGTEIYKIYLPYVETIYLTRIHHTFEGDTYFPPIDWSQWEEKCIDRHSADDRNKYDYTYYIYDRIRKLDN